MARLIPALIVFFYFSLLLSSSNAGSPVTSPEDDVTNLPPATFNEEDVSDLKSLIVLPTDKQLNSDPVSLVNGEKIRPDSGMFSGDLQEKDMPMARWRPMNRDFGRMRSIRCRHRHRGQRFGGGGAQIWPRKEEDDAVRDDHHRDGNREIFSDRKIHWSRFHKVDPATLADLGGDGRMIGEFKQPHFFFRLHHHHHHHHHHHDGEEMEEEREHHGRRREHGFWRKIGKFLGHF